MLIITTLGRSGSSMVAKICGELGYPTGGAWCDKSNAGLEDERAMNVNTDLLRHLDHPAIAPEMPEGYWRTIDDIENTRAVVKDPRLIDVRVFNLWIKHLKETPRVLLLHRHFAKIMQSRARYNVPLGIPKTFRSLFADFVTMLVDNEIRHRILMFPNYLYKPEQLLEALQYLGLEFDWQTGLDVCNKIIKKDMVHFT